MTQPAPELRLVENQPEPPDPWIGQTLDGRYRIERMLGKGGMGLVYEATHVILQKRLAIKVLKPEVSSDEQVMARFRREAQSASSIGSQHICDVSDFGSLPDGSKYFVMEYLDGPPLTNVIKASPMQVPAILDFAIQLCDALGAAHERGIVHRDLKPDNIHLVRQGNRESFVKVLDFGIAKVGGAADKKLTQAGQVFGTPHYMSPEQCSGREVDHRTDIYAVGIILYEAATGHVPFDADNLMGVLTKHVYEQPIPPRELPPPVDVPPGLEAIILRSLAKQPQDRYQSFAELKQDLIKVQQGGTPDAVMRQVGGGVARTQMISPEQASQLGAVTPAMAGMAEEPPKKSNVGLFVGALLGLTILGGGAFAGAFFFLGQEEDPVTPEVASDPGPTDTTEVADTTNDVADPTADPTGTEGTENGAGAEGQTPIEPPPPEQVMVRITTEPEGAEIYAGDGTLIGNSPLEVPRPNGTDTMALTIRSSGYQERSFPVSSVTAAAVTVRLEREHRASSRGRRQQATTTTPPQVRPLAPDPAPTGGRRHSIQSEIVNPW